MKGIEKIYYNPNFANFYNLNEGLIQFYSIDAAINILNEGLRLYKENKIVGTTRLAYVNLSR